MQRCMRYQGGYLRSKSPELFRECEICARPNLPLTGDTLITEGILIFEM